MTKFFASLAFAVIVWIMFIQPLMNIASASFASVSSAL